LKILFDSTRVIYEMLISLIGIIEFDEVYKNHKKYNK